MFRYCKQRAVGRSVTNGRADEITNGRSDEERKEGTILKETTLIFKYKSCSFLLEQFSIECRISITTNLDNTARTQRTNENSKQLHVTSEKRGKNACNQVAIVFGFASDWLSRWRELFEINHRA